MIKIEQEKGNISTVLCNIYNIARARAGCYPDQNISVAEIDELTQDEEIYVATVDDQIVGFIGYI